MLTRDEPKGEGRGVEKHFVLTANVRSVQGSTRVCNEDDYYVDLDSQVFVVADGIRGSRAGEIASELACRLLGDRLSSLRWTHDAHGLQMTERIRETFVEVNDLLLAHCGDDPRISGMGTTAAAVMIIGEQLFVAGLGDSRVYLLRDGECRQLTVDHTLARALVEAGILSSENARFHPYRNVLHKHLGCKELADGADVDTLRLKAGDRLLLATDGLTGRVDNRALQELIDNAATPGQAADRLLEAALDRGATDDITCVVVFVDAPV